MIEFLKLQLKRVFFWNPFITTRYFIVFYTAKANGGTAIGQNSIRVKGYKPFLNRIQTVNEIMRSPKITGGVIITGFNEVKKHEYKRFNEKITE